jgi:hypothetical protein
MLELLSIWTVYDHPNDYPNCFVARRFEVNASGPVATTDIVCHGDLDTLRRAMVRRGLTALCRSPGDDPKIVESWL